MHCKTVLCLTLLGSSTAQYQSRYANGLHPRDALEVLTLPSIKSALKHGTEGVTAVGNALKSVTAANAKEQLGVVNSALLKLASDVTGDTKKMKSSGAIGIGEILGLLSEAPRNELIGAISGLFSALNNTAFAVGDKREIIKASGGIDIIVPGIKAQRQGLVDIVSIVPSQVPSIAKGPINGIINSIFNGAGKSASPPTRAALFRRQTTPKGKGKGTTGKSTTPKASSSGSASSSSGGLTLDSLLSSPESLEATGKVIDGALDQLISWLRGTTDNLLPPELLESLAKGVPKGGPKGAPKGATPPPTPK